MNNEERTLQKEQLQEMIDSLDQRLWEVYRTVHDNYDADSHLEYARRLISKVRYEVNKAFEALQ